MGRVRDWFLERFGVEEVELPPETVITVGVVALWCAGIVVAALADEGIQATFAEQAAFDGLGFPQARILCEARHAEAAARVIDAVLKAQEEPPLPDDAPGWWSR